METKIIFIHTTCLFFIGLFGIFITRRNLIVVIMSIELMLLAININILATSILLDDIYGQIMALMILTVAAAEAAIGLAIVVTYYRLSRLIAIDTLRLLKV